MMRGAECSSEASSFIGSNSTRCFFSSFSPILTCQHRNCFYSLRSSQGEDSSLDQGLDLEEVDKGCEECACLIQYIQSYESFVKHCCSEVEKASALRHRSRSGEEGGGGTKRLRLQSFLKRSSKRPPSSLVPSSAEESRHCSSHPSNSFSSPLPSTNPTTKIPGHSARTTLRRFSTQHRNLL